MGTQIGDLLEKKEISLDNLNGLLLGVDSYNIIYQFLSSIRGIDGTPLMDSKGNITSHLTGLLYRTTNLLEKGVKPVFVFDGIPHKLKKETLKKRTAIRTEAFSKHEKALKEGDIAEAKKYGSRALKLSKEMIEDAKLLLSYMGLPVLVARSEGEAQISYMAEKGDLFGVISQDFDSLLFGTPRLYRNITVSGKRKLPGRNVYIDVSPELIELEANLKALKIDRKKLIWLAILVGTDFNEKFPKIGPKTALKLVQNNNSFEEIIKESKFEPDFDFKKVEEIFLKPSFTSNYKIEFKPPDRGKIREFLCEQHDFNISRVDSALDKLEKKAEEKGQQQSLDKWFK